MSRLRSQTTKMSSKKGFQPTCLTPECCCKARSWSPLLWPPPLTVSLWATLSSTWICCELDEGRTMSLFWRLNRWCNYSLNCFVQPGRITVWSCLALHWQEREHRWQNFIKFEKKINENLVQHFAFSSSFAAYLLYPRLLIKAFDIWHLHNSCKVYFNCTSNILVRLFRKYNRRTAFSV